MKKEDLIKTTFFLSENCSSGIACLKSIIKYYGYSDNNSLLVETNNSNHITFADLKAIAGRLGFRVNIKLLDFEDLKLLQFPIILLLENELREVDFSICYGFDGSRFIVGEPSFGLMQYFPEELTKMWIRGIALV
ncbi:MAG: cysteine peptidase family C39 domain-containing protein [Bacteroides sp.]|nr:cysteine peptidase family C39 domain-containing protein [Bacteroides sp.]